MHGTHTQSQWNGMLLSAETLFILCARYKLAVAEARENKNLQMCCSPVCMYGRGNSSSTVHSINRIGRYRRNEIGCSVYSTDLNRIIMT